MAAVVAAAVGADRHWPGYFTPHDSPTGCSRRRQSAHSGCSQKWPKLMRLFKSGFSAGLPPASGHRTPSLPRAFPWACLIGYILVAGCSTIDSKNASPKPWNRPTKADVSQDWWFKDGYYDATGNQYP